MSRVHAERKLGRRTPKRARAIRFATIRTGALPAHPVAVDHLRDQTFGLYGNDTYGTCGPTAVANHLRLVTGALLREQIVPSLDDVYDLYRRSGNPRFPQDDNGVDMQTMLEELLRNGIGDGKGGIVKPVAFAQVNVLEDDELEAGVAATGGLLWGVNLLAAQEIQTDAKPPRWDYKNSSEWGRHAVLNGAFEPTLLEDVISWVIRVQTTERFRAEQLEEAWLVIWPWHLEHPGFLEGVDLAKLAEIYHDLTGKTLPLPEPPPPPAPGPPGPLPIITTQDAALWEELKPWALARHVGSNRRAARSVIAWAKSLGLA